MLMGSADRQPRKDHAGPALGTSAQQPRPLRRAQHRIVRIGAGSVGVGGSAAGIAD